MKKSWEKASFIPIFLFLFRSTSILLPPALTTDGFPQKSLLSIHCIHLPITSNLMDNAVYRDGVSHLYEFH